MLDHSTEPRNRIPPEMPGGAERKPFGEAPHEAPPHGTASYGTAAELFAPLMAHFEELREYIAYYFAAQTDLVRAKVRKLVLYALLAVAGATALLTTLVVAVVMVLIGIAGGLGELIAHRPWAGSLVTGGVLLAVAFGTVRLVLPQWLLTSRRKIKEKYDRRRQTQRARFGHDVDEVRKN
ncbi:MAG: phage holin family protein [Planctomycetia bacterium]|nr:phage holin family protein [Planctomycetia bacterium]